MINSRIKALQDKIVEKNIDLYFLNTSDYHLSEYVPEYFKTISYFTGFTGSLASLIVDKKDAYIFVDGRYHTQADKQCLKYGVKVVKLGKPGALDPLKFIEKNYKNGIVGLDGKRTSTNFVNTLLKQNNRVKSIDIYSDLIEGRAPLLQNKIYELDLKYTGLTRRKKIELIQYCLKGNCHIVNNLESIAYLLNLRGSDILYTPVFLSYLVFYNNNVYLFCDLKKIDEKTLDNLFADGIIVRQYETYYDFIKIIGKQTIVLDDKKVNFETYSRVCKNNNIVIRRSFIDDMKSIKNNVEQKNTKLAHIYDGVAMVRFLMWLDSVDVTCFTEYDIACKINEFRLGYKAFDLSFNSIVAYNENSAIIHYTPSPSKSSKLDSNGILLLDTGAHYYEGTIDITRTIALGPVSNSVKKHFTLVLKSMLNLSSLVFIRGLSGNQIDVIARKDLWAEGLDYRHGTGHGVGHVLSVHEGPPNIRYMSTANGDENVEIKPGMIFSDEPGVYFEGKFGVRCENLLLCKKVSENEYGEFLKFDTLTMVPFDLNLIDKQFLDEKSIELLNGYHRKVYNTLSPYLDDEEKEFLKKLTTAI